MKKFRDMHGRLVYFSQLDKGRIYWILKYIKSKTSYWKKHSVQVSKEGITFNGKHVSYETALLKAFLYKTCLKQELRRRNKKYEKTNKRIRKI